MIIGLGTGRCGTRSLAKLLTENGIPTTHEKFRLVWMPDKERCLKALSNLAKNDVGFYWLNYVDIVLDEYPDTKFICLKREKDGVLKSFLRTTEDPILASLTWTKYTDRVMYRLCDHVTQEEIDSMDESTREWVETYWEEDFMEETRKGVQNHFPEYNLKSKEEYLGQYYDDYCIKSEQWQEKYPNNFMIIDMNLALNTDEGRDKILTFIGACPNTHSQ